MSLFPEAAQAEIKDALARKPNTMVYSYAGQRHAFSRHNGTHYNAAAAHLPTAGKRIPGTAASMIAGTSGRQRP